MDDVRNQLKQFYPDLYKFLDDLRNSGKNMFVAPIDDIGYFQKYESENSFIVYINVVWESYSLYTDHFRGIYGAKGDVGYIEFKLNTRNEIIDYIWKGMKNPPNYKSFDEMDMPIKRYIQNTNITSRSVLTEDHKINNLPTFYDDCSYGGIYIFMDYGTYGPDWLKSCRVYKSISSIDVTNCYAAVMWRDKDLSVKYDNERINCFGEEMNDKTHSIDILPSPTCNGLSSSR